MIHTRAIVLVGMVVFAAASRLVPHPFNFTPVAAMALFGGAHFASRWSALAVPLAAMYASDVILGHFVYGFGWVHPYMPAVYGSMALIAGLGMLLRRRRNFATIAGATVTASVMLFVITNLAVWLQGSLYPRTADGLIACYIAAIPFFGHTLAGDAFYASVLFGGLSLLQSKWPGLRDTQILRRPVLLK